VIGITVSDTDILEVSIHVAALPDTVFPYFTDPVRYARWMGTDVELEPTPGGVYRVGMRDGVQALGAFVEVDPPHRLVFTWGWVSDPNVMPGSTRVEVLLTAEDGGTRVVLRHHGLPTSEQRDHHRMGWDMYLGRLNSAVSGVDPGPDPNAQDQ
jgi:uncharacterized protein YndB with AHSA1/START domain